MKYFTVYIAMMILALGASASALAQGAAGHGGHGAAATQTPPPRDGGDHAGMPMDKSMMMLGSASDDGVKAMAHLQDLHQSLHQNMGQHNAPETHNFMVVLEEENKGKAITQGRAAVKVTGPDGQTGSAVSLTPKEGFFSADLNLKKPGRYTFTVGTKLTDGKTRQFRFNHTLE